MKLVWKGKYKNEEQLEKGVLPQGAVQFKEPETPLKVNLVAVLYMIPVLILVVVLLAAKVLISDYEVNSFYDYIGLLASLLFIIPHELLHAVCFPKDAEVCVYYSLKNLMAFVTSSYPISKARFVFLSALPSLVFGFLPLAVWLFCPASDFSSFLMAFAFANLLMGAGDFMNIKNALTQMPKMSLTQLSGFHSYWFMPQSEKETTEDAKEKALQ